MDRLFEIKGQISQFYTQHSRWIDIASKFLLALLTFTFINQNIGFATAMANPVMTIVLSLICTLLPSAMTLVFATFVVLLHIYSISLGMMIVSAAIFVVMYAMYLRYAPKRSKVVLLVLISYMLRIPVAVPVVYGLIGNPVCIVAVSMGTVFYYMIDYVKSYATLIGTVAETGLIEQITAYAQQLFANTAMWTTIISYGLVLLIVYYLKRLAVDHAWKIAIVAGVLGNLIIMVFSSVIMSVSVNYGSLVFGSVLAVVIALVVEFFAFSVDYTRTENLQFEDDEYYYYIKAVPKVSVAAKEKTVKRINERQEKEKSDKETTQKKKVQKKSEPKREMEDSDIQKIIDEELKH